MPQDVAETPVLPRHLKPHKIDLAKAIELRLKGLTYSEIAIHFGVTKSSAYEHLSTLIPSDTIDINAYKLHRADLLAGLQVEIIKNLTDGRLKKASAYQLTGMYGILHEHERLERGQSTANVQQLSILVDKITKQSTGSDPIVPASIPQDVVIDATHNEPISK